MLVLQINLLIYRTLLAAPDVLAVDEGSDGFLARVRNIVLSSLLLKPVAFSERVMNSLARSHPGASRGVSGIVEVLGRKERVWEFLGG